MLSPLHDWLLKWGMSEAGATLLTRLGGVLLVLFVALIADRVTKSVVVRGIARLAQRTTASWDDVVMRHRVLQRVAHLVPALVIYHFATPVLAGYDQLTAVVRQGALIYMIVIAALAADSVVNVGIEIVRGSRLPRELPVRSIAQVLKLVVYAVTAISVLALVLGRSPLLLLSGLGAMSAVTMLVFKDTILGFVAGIQLSANRMVSRGDWIEMPKHGADGDVLDVGLTRYFRVNERFRSLPDDLRPRGRCHCCQVEAFRADPTPRCWQRHALKPHHLAARFELETST